MWLTWMVTFSTWVNFSLQVLFTIIFIYPMLQVHFLCQLSHVEYTYILSHVNMTNNMSLNVIINVCINVILNILLDEDAYTIWKIIIDLKMLLQILDFDSLKRILSFHFHWLNMQNKANPLSKYRTLTRCVC